MQTLKWDEPLVVDEVRKIAIDVTPDVPTNQKYKVLDRNGTILVAETDAQLDGTVISATVTVPAAQGRIDVVFSYNVGTEHFHQTVQVPLH